MPRIPDDRIGDSAPSHAKLHLDIGANRGAHEGGLRAAHSHGGSGGGGSGAGIFDEERSGEGGDRMPPVLKNPGSFLPFCNSGMATSMHMRGFTSVLFDLHSRASRECAVFLFPAWVLDTPLRFALGCLGAILLGIAEEAVLALEWQAPKAGRSLPKRLLLHALLLVLGYALMLVVMVYSVELTAAAIAGLIAGRGIFMVDGPGTKAEAAPATQLEPVQRPAPHGGTPCCGGGPVS